MTLSDEELVALGREGFFVGPKEEEEAFRLRVNFLKKFKKDPDRCVNDLPLNREKVCLKEWEPLLKSFEKKMGAAPRWFFAYYSNDRLAPWQGAVCWIFTHSCGFNFPSVQLRKGFKKGRVFLCSRDEVLQHEAVHALRSSFSEPRYEEIFAHFLSQQKWRRFLGAVFRTPKEALFFGVLCFCLIATEVSVFFLESVPLMFFFQVIATFCLCACVLYFIIRLIRDKRSLKQALKIISKLVSSSIDPYLVALRLSDAEVILFAKSSLEKVRSYIKTAQKHSLRWRQTYLQFFSF